MRELVLKNFLDKHQLPNSFIKTAETFYQPLAERLYCQAQKQSSPFFVGVNGCQGSGKTTLTQYIAHYLTHKYQVNVLTMSLDDFYLSQSKREALASNVHPLFVTRGVPGTHDTKLLAKVISQLKNKNVGFKVPKFDKATDNPLPDNQWPVIEKPIDIVLLEGWCWGVKPQDKAQLITSINKLEKEHDEQNIWRNYVNEQLKSSYQPLYQAMNFWVFLQAPSFDCVYQWRQEQEKKLRAKKQHLAQSKIMSDEALLYFIAHFQRFSEQAMKTMPQISDTIFQLDEHRAIFIEIIKKS